MSSNRRDIGLEGVVEQLFLVAEVRVDELLVGFGSSRDPVDTCPGQSVLGELGGGSVEDALLRCGGVPGGHDSDHTTN